MPLDDVLAMEADAAGVGNGVTGAQRSPATPAPAGAQARPSLAAALETQEVHSLRRTIEVNPLLVIAYGVLLADLLLLYIALRV